MGADRKSLVIAPDCTFARLSDAVEGAGWFRRTEGLTAPSLRPGEPELISWSHQADGGRLVYTFNPVVSLRVLAVHGADAAEHLETLAARLPLLRIEKLPALLASTEPREVLLGILAAGALDAVGLLESISRLIHHPSPVVAKAAARVQAALAQHASRGALEALATRKAAVPDRSVLFPKIPDVHARRQVLRWLMHDGGTSTGAAPNEPIAAVLPLSEPIEAVLRAGLEDPDWEVRATAMIAAARLKVAGLHGLVRRVSFPTSGREGLGHEDRRLLTALRRASLVLLEPAGVDALRDERDEGRRQLLRCVAGLPAERHDPVFRWVRSLSEPIPEPPPPARVPAGWREERGVWYDGEAGLAWVWVPPLVHWLGDFGPGEAPLREVRSSGCFLTREPLDNRSRGDRSGIPADDVHDISFYSWEDALRVCVVLSAQIGVDVTLPTADCWEMGARGTDGRRYPWGNGLEKDWTDASSPWGARRMVGDTAQWVRDGGEVAAGWIRGGPDQLRCAQRRRGAHGERAAVRPMVVP